ncbi:hypothetical protein AAFF_G00012740 [Aldrovandia affinis]|uniref:Uncharacterized protein n=1 Tax=Aldrovandia affinis TaxID=143900 RepID=A0AAD7S8Y8_9TELE|nr:hypothetical protein AAFF_G00012740 [Aldrovandia affinis]
MSGLVIAGGLTSSDGRCQTRQLLALNCVTRPSAVSPRLADRNGRRRSHVSRMRGLAVRCCRGRALSDRNIRSAPHRSHPLCLSGQEDQPGWGALKASRRDSDTLCEGSDIVNRVTIERVRPAALALWSPLTRPGKV